MFTAWSQARVNSEAINSSAGVRTFSFKGNNLYFRAWPLHWSRAVSIRALGRSSMFSKMACVLGLMVAGSSVSASAQNAGSLLNLLGGLSQTALTQAAQVEWQRLPEPEIACIDRALRTRRASVQLLIQRGVGPSDAQISDVRAGCLTQTAQQVAPRPVSGSPYSVEGLALGGRVSFDSSVYREYQCAPSEQFEGFIRCQRTRSDREARGQFTSSYSILHSPDGTVAYVNRSLTPAFFEGREAQDEIDRLSNKHGATPRVIPLPAGSGRPSGFIAVWGDVVLEPLDAASLTELAVGRNVRAGFLIDHIGNFQRSAQAGLPVYRLGGGAGYVWSGSWDQGGRGNLRFLAIDPSAIAREKRDRIAVPAEPPTIAAERQRVEAGRPSQPGVALPPGPPAVARSDRRRLSQIPESCEAAKQLGKGQMSLVDPLSQKRSPGPACQALRSCKTDLTNQIRDVFVFLRENPDVVAELRSTSPDLLRAQSPSAPARLLQDLEGAARRLDSFSSEHCDYLWLQMASNWINLEGKGNAASYPFEGLMEGGQRLFSKVKSEFNAADAEYRALLDFNDRYPGVERFERAYQSYAQAVQSDDIAGTLRERSVFLREMDGAKARKQLLDEQAAELSRLTTSQSDMAAACNREELSRFSNQDILATLSALKADSEKYTGMKPAERGDISSQLKVLTVRYRDLENAVRAARAEKTRIEEFRLMLVQRETFTRRLVDAASRDDMKGALDPQSLRAANEIAERLHQFSSLELGVIRERQSDFGETLQQLAALERQFLAAQARYNEAKARDERRLAVLEKAEPVFSQFSGTVSGRLSGEAASQLTNLRAKRDILARLDGIRLLERPDYTADLAVAEDTITRLGPVRAEIDEVDRLAADLTALKTRIDARGRKLLDTATSSTLDEIDKSVASLAGAKIPLVPEAREKLPQVRSRLERLASIVDAVMDMGTLDPESRTFLTAHPEFREQPTDQVNAALVVHYAAVTALDYCNDQSWFGLGKYRNPAAEARRRIKILEDISVHILHRPTSEIDNLKAAMEGNKAQLQFQMKWDKDGPPQKVCDEVLMTVRLDQRW
jgi:hypothetical protein